MKTIVVRNHPELVTPVGVGQDKVLCRFQMTIWDSESKKKPEHKNIILFRPLDEAMKIARARCRRFSRAMQLLRPSIKTVLTLMSVRAGNAEK